jgi:hypothetical protein
MPSAEDLLTGAILVGIYFICILAVYLQLRSSNWKLMASVALSVTLTQAIFSVIFQARFLMEWPPLGLLGSGIFAAWSLRNIQRYHSTLKSDLQHAMTVAKEHLSISIPIIACIAYTFTQAMLLPQKNIDAQTYHFPRVWLFIQNNTFFLEHFTRYHEVIFPVGSDILFYPFIKLNVSAGLAIFSLSSYIAIGAGVYSIARSLTNQRNAATCMLIMLSLSVITLQAATVKNDILMASVALTALLIAIQSSDMTSYRRLLLLLCLCVFGMSIKATFVAFVPGLFVLVVCKTKLWQLTTVRRLLHEARANIKLTLLLVIPLLIASQVWLYSWNMKHYSSWSGPESFTHRHTQNDGFKGFSANIIRYGFHSLEVGFITNKIVLPSVGIPSISETLTHSYDVLIEPYFQGAGSERGPFYTDSITHEDYSWFGPLGALLLFVCLPLALIRAPSTRLLLLPAIGYYLIISAGISWMIWNGRFMTTFFIALTPALAITLNKYSRPWLNSTIIVIAISSLLIVKTSDFSRPVFAIGKMASLNKDLSFIDIIDYSFKQKENAWIKAALGKSPDPGSPNELLKSIPQYAEVALIGFGRFGHINFYKTRPDITWTPLNGSPSTGEIETDKALNRFIQSRLKYGVVVGEGCITNFFQQSETLYFALENV